MGLALLIVVLQDLALRTGDEHYDDAARFWAQDLRHHLRDRRRHRHPDGVPVRDELGAFSHFAGRRHRADARHGGRLRVLPRIVVPRRSSCSARSALGRGLHWLAGRDGLRSAPWLSGFFIVATNAWMQHPVGYAIEADGRLSSTSFWALLLNPWALWQYLPTHERRGRHRRVRRDAALGAFYLLRGTQSRVRTQLFLRLGVTAACRRDCLSAFPTGDRRRR